MIGITALCTPDENDPNVDMNNLREFGVDALRKMKSFAARIAKAHNGEYILTKETWGIIEDVIMQLRHLNWTVLQVEAHWAGPNASHTGGQGFANVYGVPIRQLATDAELQYGELRKVLFI